MERKNDFLYLSFLLLFILITNFFIITLSRKNRKALLSEKAALLASRAKSDFLANMSHELRTPLNAIIGFSDIMVSGYLGKLNDKQKDRVNDINYCGHHLLSLINDILLFSKGEAGKIDLMPEEVKIRDLIKDSLRIFGEKHKNSKTLLDKKMQESPVVEMAELKDSLPILYVDKLKMKQVLLNLISNAVKFTAKNGSVTIDAKIDNEKNCYIIVSDNGIGMTEEEISISLSTFGQVYTKNANRGTGLGLPLSKMLVELHDGELIVESKKGVGTKISIKIPTARLIWSHL
jgi:signal transduction histidine kinase